MANIQCSDSGAEPEVCLWQGIGETLKSQSSGRSVRRRGFAGLVARKMMRVAPANQSSRQAPMCRDNMALLAGGRFQMGSNRHYEEEAPAREVEVGSFLIDVHPVTSREFAGFVLATGYVTV